MFDVECDDSDEFRAGVFPSKVEQTYDRSFARFVGIFKARSGMKG